MNVRAMLFVVVAIVACQAACRYVHTQAKSAAGAPCRASPSCASCHRSARPRGTGAPTSRRSLVGRSVGWRLGGGKVGECVAGVCMPSMGSTLATTQTHLPAYKHSTSTCMHACARHTHAPRLLTSTARQAANCERKALVAPYIAVRSR